VIIGLLKQVYMPWTWSDLLYAFKDAIDLQSAIFSNCQLEIFLNVFTSFLSVEGASTLLSRVVGGFIGDMMQYIADFSNADSNWKKGKAVGQMVQILFNYTIQ
jgi:hypothetical protein